MLTSGFQKRHSQNRILRRHDTDRHTNPIKEILIQLVTILPGLAASGVLTWGCLKVLHLINPTARTVNPKVLANRLKRPDVRRMQLTDHERLIAEDAVDPEDISARFDDIGGLDEQKRELYMLTVLPLKVPEVFSKPGSLLKFCRGILLYGAPGTGKTMLAKAIAKESGSSFINVRLSTILSKYYGESNKIIAALWSLAHKLAPTILFFDEMDAFFTKRGHESESGCWLAIRAEFMSAWDGLLSDSKIPILVLGATNRPNDLDPAILRRLSRQFEIGVPDPEDREKILGLLLQHEDVDETVCLTKLAAATEGYSGSDLKHLCHAAAMIPLHELIDCGSGSLSALTLDEATTSDLFKRRKMTMQDFSEAVQRVQRTGQQAANYARKKRHSTSAMPAGGQVDDFPEAMQLLCYTMAQAANAAARENESGQRNRPPDTANGRDQV